LTQPDDLLVLPRLEGWVPVNDERDRTLLRSGAAPALAEVVFAMQEPDFAHRLPRVLTRTEGSLGFCPSLLQLLDVDVAVDHPLRAILQLLFERSDALAQADGFLVMLVVVASEEFAPQSQVVAVALQGELGVRPAVGARCAVVAGARLCRDPAELPRCRTTNEVCRSARPEASNRLWRVISSEQRRLLSSEVHTGLRRDRKLGGVNRPGFTGGSVVPGPRG
jgi:hypothetical protein